MTDQDQDATLERRRRDARSVIDTHVMLAAGASMIPSPIVDVVAIAAIEVRLIGALARVYDFPVPHKLVLGKLLVSLIGSVGPAYLTTKLYAAVKVVPIVGHAALASVLAVTNGAAVYAVGKIFQKHYESGGTFLTGDPSGVRSYFKARYKEGKTSVSAALRSGSVSALPAGG